MRSTQQQLMGVDEFLDWRPLEFVDEIPDALVCTICGVIAALPKRILTCCHVFCPACYESIAERERISPVERGWFLSETVETLDSRCAGLKELRVRCPNSPRGCTFVGKVSSLKQHFLEQCRLAGVQCPRCAAAMPQREALDHYLQHCSGKPAAKYGAVRKLTSFELAAVAPGAASHENSSRSSGGCSGSRRRKKKSGDKPSSVHKASSGEICSAAAIGKDPLVAMIKDCLQDDAGSSIRSASGGSSKVLSFEISLIKRSSGANSSRNKIPKGSKSADSAPKVASHEQFVTKVDSVINKAQKDLDTPSTSKQQPPPSPGACGMLSAAKPAVSSPRHKTAAAAEPAGFAFCYVTALEDAESRLTCGQEVVLRSDSFLIADCSFRIHARLRRDKDGVVLASFALCVCGGTWQRIAEWSLSTVMNLVLVHPWDQSLNVRLPLVPNPDAVPMPPGANLGRWDFWSPTSELKLRDLKARGFLSSRSVCVAVEVE